MPTAWVEELIRDLRTVGYQVPIRDGKAEILWRGESCRWEDGRPIKLHMTPREDPAERKNTVLALVRAGVLEDDPRRIEHRRKMMLDPEVKAARQAARLHTQEAKSNRVKSLEAGTRRRRDAQDDVRDAALAFISERGISKAAFSRLLLAEAPEWKNFNTCSVWVTHFLQKQTTATDAKLQAVKDVIGYQDQGDAPTPDDGLLRKATREAKASHGWLDEKIVIEPSGKPELEFTVTHTHTVDPALAELVAEMAKLLKFINEKVGA